MKSMHLLRVMIAKELRTTLRERSQLLGFAGTLVGLVLVIVLLRQQAASTHPHNPALARIAASQPTTSIVSRQWSPRETMAARWVSISIGAGVGLFLSLGYLMSATLASFAGEKEGGTLEILLAAPISDNRLYLFKCLSILLPMAAIGYIFLLIGGVAARLILSPMFESAPINLLFYGCILSLPLLLMPELLLVGMGAAISARADTQKGAGQVLGGAFFVLFFGGFYGVPLLIRYTRLRQPLEALGRAWLELPFATQYAAAFVLLAAPAATMLLLGRAAFRRDRLLA